MKDSHDSSHHTLYVIGQWFLYFFTQKLGAVILILISNRLIFFKPIPRITDVLGTFIDINVN
jgi:hypothetical protein